jgi:hypothetical protein
MPGTDAEEFDPDIAPPEDSFQEEEVVDPWLT